MAIMGPLEGSVGNVQSTVGSRSALMSMWPIRLNGVVLHAAAAFTRHLKSPPLQIYLKCVIKSTRMDLLSLWCSNNSEGKHSHMEGVAGAHVCIWLVCFNYNRPHNSDPADKKGAAPRDPGCSVLWCFSRVWHGRSAPAIAAHHGARAAFIGSACGEATAGVRPLRFLARLLLITQVRPLPLVSENSETCRVRLLATDKFFLFSFTMVNIPQSEKILFSSAGRSTKRDVFAAFKAKLVLFFAPVWSM